MSTPRHQKSSVPPPSDGEVVSTQVIKTRNPDGSVTTTTRRVIRRLVKAPDSGEPTKVTRDPVKLSSIIGDKTGPTKSSPIGMKRAGLGSPSAKSIGSAPTSGVKSDKPLTSTSLNSKSLGKSGPIPINPPASKVLMNHNHSVSKPSETQHKFGENKCAPTPLPPKSEGKKLFGAGNSRFKEVGKNATGKVVDDVQDYEKIKAEYGGGEKLFEDDIFPANDSSIYYSASGKQDVIWKRPHELSENPQFFCDGASRFDVNQGELGNCWFLAAVASLTMVDNLFYQVVPKDNSFENYCGAFHFRFWQYGKWLDIVVDDRLPCNSHGRLVYMHSTDKDEFWSALLEKAYAKLNGSYEALSGGLASEALQDFSGGLVEVIDLKETRLKIFSAMEKAFKRQSFMSCALKAHPSEREAKLSVGLVRGHAYSITGIHSFELPNKPGKVELIRIRNPWGNEFEWKGAWSDGSKEWTMVPEKIQKEIGLSFEDDGEFWMSIKDFKEYYDTLEIVNLSPDLPDDNVSSGKSWNTSVFEGSWVPGCTAGGCTNFINRDPKTYATNPQYIVTFDDPDEDGDPEKCTVLIALMQKNRRAKRKEGVGCLSIGFSIYELDESKFDEDEEIPNPLDLEFFMYNSKFGDSGRFVNLREVSGRFEMKPKINYCIIPSSFHPNEEGDFLIRVFSESNNSMKENTGDVGLSKIDEKVEKLAEKDNKDTITLLFKKVSGEDQEISWTVLKKLLDDYLKKEFDFDGFGKEVVRSMVSMVDLDRSGKVGLEEFGELWKCILNWKNAFKLFDEDNSKNLNSFELRKALQSAGYSINNRTLEALVLRYGDDNGNISFEDFIMCSVKLKTMIATFKERDIKGTNEVKFNLSEWVEKTVYL